MQIDFHHAVTYVAARIAGFDPSQADVIDYSAQYVDDATTEGVVHFDNNAMYARIHSAHKTMDLGNLNERHRRWIEKIERGEFSFGPAKIQYAAEGDNSWKNEALGSSWDLRVHKYDPAFLTSNWKLFHDALQLHRLTVLHDILPKYGICTG